MEPRLAAIAPIGLLALSARVMNVAWYWHLKTSSRPLLAAVAGSLLLNFYFAPPLHTLTIAQHENLIALAVFLLVAAGVSGVVDTAARRSREAARFGADAEVLSTLAGNVLRGEHELDALLGRLRETFGLDSVTLLERTDHATYCPYKGDCAYYSIPLGGERTLNAVWTYESPYAAVKEIAQHLAFYPDRVDSIDVKPAA